MSAVDENAFVEITSSRFLKMAERAEERNLTGIYWLSRSFIL